jgi:hypothetical protein
LKNDPAPSPIIFSILSVLDPAKGKLDWLAEIPAMTERPDSTADLLDSPGASEIAKFIHRKSYDCSVEGQKYQGRTDVTIVEKNKNISVSSLEDLASCPQMFWFRRIMKLKSGETFSDLPLGKQDRGNIFHEIAEKFILGLQSDFPHQTYKQIGIQIDGKEVQRRIYKVIEDLFFSDENNVSSQHLITQTRWEQWSKQFSRYFEVFLSRAGRSEHILSDYYPVLVEQEFNNIELGKFSFQGYIDRIDYNPTENIVIVLDYKTGRIKKPGQEEAEAYVARSTIQLPVYLRAAVNLKELPGLNQGVKFQAALIDVFNPSGDDIVFWEVENQKVELSSDAQLNSAIYKEILPSLDVLYEICAQGHYFAVGHKKKNDAQNDWVAPCTYCDYGNICDRYPYDAMWQRLQSDALSVRYLYEIHNRKKGFEISE